MSQLTHTTKTAASRREILIGGASIGGRRPVGGDPDAGPRAGKVGEGRCGTPAPALGGPLSGSWIRRRRKSR
jgi:hypothetical protein